MYFISYHPLKERLRNRSLTDKEALPYLIVFTAITAIALTFPAFEEKNSWDYVSGVLSVIFAIGGVIYAYRCNGGRDGYDLLHKYVVLGWVVIIRCILILIPFSILAFILADVFDLSTDDTGLFDVILIAFIEFIFYQRIGRHMRDTTKIQSEQDAPSNR